MSSAWVSADGLVEHWMAWLALGVTLQVPEAKIPYCDVTESTLRALGEGWYERADTWRGFEAGHGYYGSTDRSTLDASALRGVLRDYAARCPERVRLVDAQVDRGIDAVEALALARRGVHAISPWFATGERGTRRVVVGGDGEAFCVTFRAERVEWIESLDGAQDPLLRGLVIPRASLVDADPSRFEASRRHGRRLDALMRELVEDPRRALRGRRGSFVKVGAHFAGVLCESRNHALRVHELVGPALRTWVGRALLEDDGLCSEALDDGTREEVCRIEERLAALHAGLRSGEIAYEFGRWHAWIDGVAREVDVKDGVPVAVADGEASGDLSHPCAEYVCEGEGGARFHPIDEAFRAAARALIAAKGR
jgi:hypothetical protein